MTYSPPLVPARYLPGASPTRSSVAYSVVQPAVFLDRDGVIIQNRADYVRAWDHVEFLAGAVEALRRLAASEYNVVVVTNQSAVGRGIMSAEVMQAINAGVVERVQDAGGRIDAVYTCVHRPEDGCLCRKPQPGMLLTAAQDLGLDLGRSFLIGDAVTDIDAALSAGCRPLMVRTGRGEAQLAKLPQAVKDRVPIFADLDGAVRWILERKQTKRQGDK